MSVRWKPLIQLIGLGIFPVVVLSGQVCRLSVAGLNRSRSVIGPVHAECPDEIVHTAPFGNWGVTSNYGQKGDSHQFDGWCQDTRTCDNYGTCTTSCTSGRYEWNSCTDYMPFSAPNCSLYNAQNCTAQVTAAGINVHGTKYIDIPVSCPSTPAQGGCADLRRYASGPNFMSLYELDPATHDDLVQTVYFPETVVELACDAWGCAPAGSQWVAPSSYNSPASPAKVYAELATVVNWAAFIDPGRVCSISRTAVAYASAASYLEPALASGSIASGFGQGLAPVTASADALQIRTSLGGASFQITDAQGSTQAAPLLYVSPTQVNFLVPEEIARGPATIAVYRGDVQLFTGKAQIEDVAPGLFSANSDGRGVASAYALRVAADGTAITQLAFYCPAGPGTCTFEPIDMGAPEDRTFLSLFGTGIRNHPGLSSVGVNIGGVEATVLYAGPQGQYAGLDQVNVEVPQELRGRSQVEVALAVASKPANKVTVSFR